MRPRANTLGVIIHNHKILVEEKHGQHSKGTGYYYRPIGGTIELGEHSRETLVREYHEELAADITIIRYICCLENIFTVNGSIGHEITQIYEVEFDDQSLYKAERLKVTEDSDISFACWIPLSDFTEGSKTLYPNGLTAMLL